jgi:hypothetical protein
MLDKWRDTPRANIWPGIRSEITEAGSNTFCMLPKYEQNLNKRKRSPPPLGVRGACTYV